MRPSQLSRSLVSKSILPTPILPGSDRLTREPTGSCADSCPKDAPFMSTPMSRFSALLMRSMPSQEGGWATRPLRSSLNNIWIESKQLTDSALYSGEVFNLLLQFSICIVLTTKRDWYRFQEIDDFLKLNYEGVLPPIEDTY